MTAFSLPHAGVLIGVAGLMIGEAAEPARALEVVRESVAAGALAIDTARAYATVDDEASGERLAATARRYSPSIPVITKAGHFRIGPSAWDVDGGEVRLRHDALLSLDVLGCPPALMLLHRTDQVDDLDGSVRALANLRDEGLVAAIGLSNATVEQIERARSITAIDAVQNRFALGLDTAEEYRYCARQNIPFLAYAPFAGPRADPLATRLPLVAEYARDRSISVHKSALAAMMDVMPGAWPVVGPTRVETALDSISAAALEVDDALRRSFVEDLRARGGLV